MFSFFTGAFKEHLGESRTIDGVFGEMGSLQITSLDVTLHTMATYVRARQFTIAKYVMAAVSSSWTCSFISFVHGSTTVIHSSGICTGGNLPETVREKNSQHIRLTGFRPRRCYKCVRACACACVCVHLPRVLTCHFSVDTLAGDHKDGDRGTEQQRHFGHVFDDV